MSDLQRPLLLSYMYGIALTKETILCFNSVLYHCSNSSFSYRFCANFYVILYTVLTIIWINRSADCKGKSPFVYHSFMHVQTFVWKLQREQSRTRCPHQHYLQLVGHKGGLFAYYQHSIIQWAVCHTDFYILYNRYFFIMCHNVMCRLH